MSSSFDLGCIYLMSAGFAQVLSSASGLTLISGGWLEHGRLGHVFSSMGLSTWGCQRSQSVLGNMGVGSFQLGHVSTYVP